MRVLLLLVLFLCNIANAQIVPPVGPPIPVPPIQEPTPQENREAEDIVPGKGDIRKYVHIIVDQSGSMNDDELQQAINFAVGIASQAFDEYYLKVSVFAGGTATFTPGDGCDVYDKNPSWMVLPSGNNAQAMMTWLQTRHVATHKTLVAGAMTRALAERVDELTVIVIGDMQFADINSLEERIKVVQKEREKANVAKASIIFVNLADRDYSDVLKVYDMSKRNNWFMMNTKPKGD